LVLFGQSSDGRFSHFAVRILGLTPAAHFGDLLPIEGYS
jgi:hypothetical protein